MRKRQYTALVQSDVENTWDGDVLLFWKSYVPFIETTNEKKEETQSSSIPRTIDLNLPCPVIHNLVVTCKLQTSVYPLNLHDVYLSLPNAFYDRSRFAATTIRTTSPVATALLFSSGKVVLTGAKGFKESCCPRAKTVCFTRRAGRKVRDRGFKKWCIKMV